VTLRAGEGVPHVLGTRVIVEFDARACPHVVVHAFFHEIGHVQMLPLDVAVFSVLAPLALGVSWLLLVGAFLAWTFVWREVTAEVYAVAKLGLRNALRGYTHLARRTGRAPTPRAAP
jgi:hypothetical protein